MRGGYKGFCSIGFWWYGMFGISRLLVFIKFLLYKRYGEIKGLFLKRWLKNLIGFVLRMCISI